MSTIPVTPIAKGGASAEASAFGGHVLTLIGPDSRPVLFLSKRAVLDGSTAIRGGIPVCLPWFGAPSHSRASFEGASSSHGFARISDWDLVSSSADSLVLELVHRRADRAGVFPHDFRARLSASLDASGSLALVLELANEDDHPFTADAALHSYFAVSDVRDVLVEGLEGARCVDSPTGAEFVQDGPLRFAGPTDLLCDHQGAASIVDPGWNRRIVVEKTGSASTVVWNPWDEAATAMRDLGDEEWTGFACVESAFVRERAATIEAGASRVMTVRIRVEEI